MAAGDDFTLVGETITGENCGWVSSISGETVDDKLGAAEQCEHERRRNKHRTKGLDGIDLCAIIKPAKS
jgi:hypothetical protein